MKNPRTKRFQNCICFKDLMLNPRGDVACDITRDITCNVTCDMTKVIQYKFGSLCLPCSAFSTYHNGLVAFKVSGGSVNSRTFQGDVCGLCDAVNVRR